MGFAVVVEGGLRQGEVAGSVDDAEGQRRLGLGHLRAGSPQPATPAAPRAPPSTARREISFDMFPPL